MIWLYDSTVDKNNGNLSNIILGSKIADQALEVPGGWISVLSTVILGYDNSAI